MMEAQQPCAIRAQQPYVLGQARKELLPMIQARKNAIIRIQMCMKRKLYNQKVEARRKDKFAVIIQTVTKLQSRPAKTVLLHSEDFPVAS